MSIENALCIYTLLLSCSSVLQAGIGPGIIGHSIWQAAGVMAEAGAGGPAREPGAKNIL